MEGVWLAFRCSRPMGEWIHRKIRKMDRRDILSLSATTAVGIIFSLNHIFAQVPASESEMKTLSDYMSDAGNRALPAEAAEQAKHHLLDTLASMISGSELPPGQAALRYIGSHAGQVLRRSWARRLPPRRSMPRSRMELWHMRTKPTTRITPRARTRAALLYRQRLPPASNSASTVLGSFAP